MYTVTKRVEVAGSHRLNLNYESKCSNVHGHNWIITVECICDRLNENGMVIDFTDIKNIVMKLDHNNLNDLFSFNPTAENIAHWICDELNKKGSTNNLSFMCRKVTVQESEGNVATYEI